MTFPLLAAVLLSPAALQANPLEAPVGTSSEFQSLALSVRQASNRDMAKATRLAGLLPRRDPAVYWDDSKVPAVSRAAFRAARDYALAEWARMLPEFKARLVTKPSLATRGLVFNFEPRLLKGAGATHFLGMDANAPRLETVIGLRRGEFYTGEVDVHNEVLYALGMYLGVLPNTAFGGAMGRTDVRASVATRPGAYEAAIAEAALVHASGLRQQLSLRKALPSGNARLWIEAKSHDLGVRVQGQPAETNFAISNNGTGPMLLRIAGDCSCLVATGPTRLEPGESGVIRARYDTSEIGGVLSRNVIVLTTDPDSPRVLVAMKVAVRTLARFIVPGGPTLAPSAGEPVDLYFVHDESKPVTIASARVDGMEGDLKVEPWSGTLADAALKEGPLPRRGYRIRFTPKAIPPGRSLASFTITTGTGETFVGNAFLQRGITANPPSAMFPDPGTTPGRAEIVLTNPGKPFRILSVRAEGAGISAAMTKAGARADEQTLAVTLDPAKLVPGQSRRIVLRTDDPALPEIVVPILIPED